MSSNAFMHSPSFAQLSRRNFLLHGGAAGAVALGLARSSAPAFAAPATAAPIRPWPRAIVEKCNVSTIWADGRHNGFPGIARVGDYYYVTFRNATGHVSKEGTAKIFIIRSKAGDMKQWAKVAEFTHAHDARDPLVFDNHGKVQVVYHSKEDFYSQSVDGVTWSAPRELETEIVQPPAGSKLAFTTMRRWLFRIRRGPDGAFYSLARCGIPVPKSPGKFGLILYRSEDGVKFKAMHGYGEGPVSAMGPGRGTGHEADVTWAPDGTLISAIRDSRRDGAIVMGRAPNGPWRSFGSGILTFGGPALHRTKKGGILLAARHVEPPKTEPGKADAAKKLEDTYCRVVTLTPNGVEHPFRVPSRGDCAYQSFEDGPGDSVLLTYYSRPEVLPPKEEGINPAHIYLARLTVRHEEPTGKITLRMNNPTR